MPTRPMNTPRSRIDGSPGAVGGLAPRSVIARPGAKAVLLFDEVLNGTGVTTMNTPRASAVRRSPGPTGRSVVTRPGAKAVLFFSQVLDGTSVTTTPGRCAPRRRTNSGQATTVVMAPPIASPLANTGFLDGLVLDGTGNAQKTSQNNLHKQKDIS